MNMEPLFPSAFHPVAVVAGPGANLDDLLHLATNESTDLKQRLARHGAMLFRGFGVAGAADFQRAVEALGASPFGYSGGDSPRSRVDRDVYTSTDYPASENISLHNEMSYLPNWPKRVFFHCLQASSAGGQTSLASNADISASIPEEIRRKFKARKLRYIRNFVSVGGFPLGKSWQATYQTDSRDDVDAVLAGQGSTGRWESDGSLRVETMRDAFHAEAGNGADTWFNQAEQWHASALKPLVRRDLESMVGKGRLPHECEFGDGSALDESELAVIREALEKNKLLFDWRKGDVLMVDNQSMMHGREAFKGERKVLAYLSGA